MYDLSRYSAFAGALQYLFSIMPQYGDRIFVAIKADRFIRHVIGNDHIQTLALHFVPSVGQHIIGFRCEAHGVWALLSCGYGSHNIRCAYQFQCHLLRPFLYLLVFDTSRTVISDSGTSDKDIALRQ